MRFLTFTWEQFKASAQATILYNEFENYTYEITATSPGANALSAFTQDADIVDRIVFVI